MQSNRHISAEVETVARALLDHSTGDSFNKDKHVNAWYKYIPMALTVVAAQDKDTPKRDVKASDLRSRE